MNELVLAELQSLGWQWGDAGVVINFATNQGPQSVFVPLHQVWQFFARHLPLRHSVGCTQSVGGFFDSISNAVRNVSRGVKRVARHVVPDRIIRAADDIYRHVAKSVGWARHAFQSDAATYALMGLAFVPGMAPASVGFLAAQQALRRVNLGVKAAERMLSGVRPTPRMMRRVRRGFRAQKLVKRVRHAANTGQPHAAHFLNALKQLAQGV
jgi:hypothetical protein